MTDLGIWGAIILLTIATFITRSSFWLVGHKVDLPPRVQEALRYAPACALAAIIVPDLLLEQSQLALHLHNHKLVAGILAIGFFYWRKNMLQTIFVGMLAFTALRLLV